MTALKPVRPGRVPWRPLRCRRCAQLVDVLELPGPFLDGEDYLCGGCAQPVEGQK